MDKVVGENEGDTFTVDSELGLEVPQKVAKINVEELTGDEVEPLAEVQPQEPQEEKETAENRELPCPLRDPREDDTSRAHSVHWATKPRAEGPAGQMGG